MKKSLFFLGIALTLCLGLSVPRARAAITFVQATSTGDFVAQSVAQSNVTSTFGANTTSGDAIIVIAENGANSDQVTGCRDTVNATSSYVKATSIASGHGESASIWYALNITGGTKPMVTCTMSVAQTFNYLAIYEFSGVATTNAFDSSSTFEADNTTTTTLTTGTSTTNANGELIFGSLMGVSVNSWTFTPGTGFTTGINNGVAAGFASEYMIQPTAGAVSAWGTINPADDPMNMMATFEPPAVPSATNANSNTMASVLGVFNSTQSFYSKGSLYIL